MSSLGGCKTDVRDFCWGGGGGWSSLMPCRVLSRHHDGGSTIPRLVLFWRDLNAVKSSWFLTYGGGAQNCAANGFAVVSAGRDPDGESQTQRRHGPSNIVTCWRVPVRSLVWSTQGAAGQAERDNKAFWRHLEESRIFFWAAGLGEIDFNTACQLCAFPDTMYSWYHQHCSRRMTSHTNAAVVLWKLANCFVFLYF